MADPFSQAAVPADPFNGLTQNPSVPAGLSDEAIDRTARLATLSNTPTPDLLTQGYEDLTKQYADIIRQAGDQHVRMQAASLQQQDELRGIMSVARTAPEFDPSGELRVGAELAAKNSLNEDVQRRSEYALEQRALTKIQDYAAAGDYTQAKILLDNIQKGGAEDVIRDINLKRMIIHREVERAGIDQAAQPWFRHATDFLASFVGDVFLKNAMDRNNIVDIDPGMKHWWDLIISGTRQRREAATLWAMNPADFAKAVKEQVIPRVKDHASTFGYYNHSEMLNLLTAMEDTPTPWKINLSDAVAAGSLIPFMSVGKVGKIPYLLGRSGARAEMADTLASATLSGLREGPAVMAEKSGINLDDVAENLVPTGHNPTTVVDPLMTVPITGDALAGIERGQALLNNLPQFFQPGRLTPEERQVAIQAERERILQEIGRPLKDFKATDLDLIDGSQVTRFEFLIGKKKGGGFISESTAQAHARANGILNPEIVADESGQWFIKETRDLNEAGYYTTNLEPKLKNTGIAGRLVLGARHVGDEYLQTLDRVSANTRNRILKITREKYANDIAAVQGEERDRLATIMAWGENKGTWFTNNEIDEMWAKSGATKPPSEKVYKAYQAMRDVNDIEFALRNAELWKKDATRGFETVSIPTINVDRENALIGRAPGAKPKGRIYDVETGIHYHDNNPLTPEEFDAKINDGYVVVSLKNEKQLADQTTVKHFLVKKNNIQAERLRPDQLAYRAGGHRMYADKYFMKQAVWGVQPDTGERFLKNPATYYTGTRAEMETATKILERARQLYVAAKGNISPATLDDVLAPLGHMDGEDFIRHLENGIFQKDTEFIATFDRELPHEYIRAASPLDFVDTEETGFSGWLRTNGKLYYSSKGEQLLDWKGNLSRTIDPFETTNTALQNIANLTSFSDYKMSAVERWVRTYKDFLDTGGLPHNASPLTVFSEAKYRSNVDLLPMQAGNRVKQRMEAQRDIIRRNIGWRSEFDRHLESYGHDIAAYIMGEDPTSGRHAFGRNLTSWWNNSNPLNAMRGFAFDLKMGLFNVAQFPLQIQTMVASIALAGPEHGMSVMLNLPMMRLFLTKSGTEHMLNTFVERGMHEAAGMSAQDYKAMMRAAKTSGFFEFGGSHQLINSHGPNAVAGGFREGWDKFTRAGRFFFNEAEVWNRVVGWQLAWKELSRKEGIPFITGRKSGVGTRDFLNKVALRADDYSMNMMEQSSAVWQKGLLSIPTQFWAYNARMLENLVGNTFTPAQRLRLLLAQTFFYGAAGVPIVGLASQAYKNHKGSAPGLDSFYGMIDRGMLDEVIYHTTGADVLAGKRYGTGTWLTDTFQELLGMSPYGEKSFVDVTGGATYSIMKDTMTAVADVVKHVTAESGASDYPLTKEDMMRLAMNASTLSYGMKALMVYNYHMMISNKGSVIATDLPTADAFYVAMGMQPGEQEDITAAAAHLKDRKKKIDEAAKFIQDHRTQLAYQPDKRAEISAEINAFVRLLPPDIRVEALNKAHRQTPQSLYKGFTEQVEKQRAQQEMVKKYGETH